MISQKWCEFGFVCLAFNEEKSVLLQYFKFVPGQIEFINADLLRSYL